MEIKQWTHEELLQARRILNSEWRRNNPDKIKAANKKYREKIKKALSMMREGEKVDSKQCLSSVLHR